MAGRLLLRGMIAGVIAGLITFGFARFVGEPLVASAIAIEESVDAHDHGSGEEARSHQGAMQTHAHLHEHHHEQAASNNVVSRETQSGIGLLTALVVFGAAVGGLFSLVCAVAYGRVGGIDGTALSLLLAFAGFVCFSLVPGLKYPANPPAVGSPETIGARTAWFFIAIAVSIALVVVAVRGFGAWRIKLGATKAGILSVGLYAAFAAVLFSSMPAIDEVTENFPATLLWNFRLTAIGLQLIMWVTLGLVFSLLLHRAGLGWRPGKKGLAS
ncbi:membrane protein [Caballeronia arvi]|uniref:Membrane protein n=1 Tax=Caballeronia arvi TaxID=1777135 RepID=A0A158KKE0_9BURK|nr:CbtA family protein [Caballeronia arvi]SAL81229.1 membrane protein [Caballeronia arvi]